MRSAPAACSSLQVHHTVAAAAAAAVAFPQGPCLLQPTEQHWQHLQQPMAQHHQQHLVPGHTASAAHLAVRIRAVHIQAVSSVRQGLVLIARTASAGLQQEAGRTYRQMSGFLQEAGHMQAFVVLRAGAGHTYQLVLVADLLHGPGLRMGKQTGLRLLAGRTEQKGPGLGTLQNNKWCEQVVQCTVHIRTQRD